MRYGPHIRRFGRGVATRAQARFERAVVGAGAAAASAVAGGIGAAVMGGVGAKGTRRVSAPVNYKKVRRGPVLSKRRKRPVTKLERKVREIVDEGQSVGTYKKILPQWVYHLSGGANVINKQGVHEFYFAQPLELLDAVSVLFNSKAKDVNYLVTTNNLGGDPDFVIKNATCEYYVTNTSQFEYQLDVYSFKPAQDSATNITARWQASVDEVAGAGAVDIRDMYIRPEEGSGELSRYWTGVKTKKTYKIKPGERKKVCVQYLGRLPVNWEDMKFQNGVIPYKKGITQGMLMIQHMPIMWQADGNKIGVPTTAFGGMVVEARKKFVVQCPQQADSGQNVDKLIYLNGYSTELGTMVFPSKPWVDNIPTIQQ